jgi:hypothetical protein
MKMLAKQSKQPQPLSGNDLVKHLFHGTKDNEPSKIYSSEEGLDLRYSNDGLNGYGIYFADNAKYSDDYAHKIPGTQHKQMFLCLVLTGESANFGGGRGVRFPPFKPGSHTERYDSINNGNGGHFIIYDNLKQYPGYVITYQ